MKLQIDSHNSINTKPQSQTKQARNYTGIYISAINHYNCYIGMPE